ncbi:MAG: DUF971 domain-containing protein [Pirellulales bacterium]
MSDPTPTQLSRTPTGIRITWSDGQVREYTAHELRAACPCATCREKRSEGPAKPNPLAILSPAETRPMTVASLTPVGNYAYSVAFSDDHDTGIYTLELLRGLGRPVSG